MSPTVPTFAVNYLLLLESAKHIPGIVDCFCSVVLWFLRVLGQVTCLASLLACEQRKLRIFIVFPYPLAAPELGKNKRKNNNKNRRGRATKRRNSCTTSSTQEARRKEQEDEQIRDDAHPLPHDDNDDGVIYL
eukprot:3100140-Amphidinium_carterae.1